MRGSLGRIHGDESLASVRVRGGRGWRSWGNESVGGREGGREGVSGRARKGVSVRRGGANTVHLRELKYVYSSINSRWRTKYILNDDKTKNKP